MTERERIEATLKAIVDEILGSSLWLTPRELRLVCRKGCVAGLLRAAEMAEDKRIDSWRDTADSILEDLARELRALADEVEER